MPCHTDRIGPGLAGTLGATTMIEAMLVGMLRAANGNSLA